jgi:hypothetical protein
MTTSRDSEEVADILVTPAGISSLKYRDGYRSTVTEFNVAVCYYTCRFLYEFVFIQRQEL